jgi:hypothetical protein
MTTNVEHHRYSAALLDDDDHRIDLGPVNVSDAQSDQDAARLGEMRAKELLQSMRRTVGSLKIADGPRGLAPIKVRVSCPRVLGPARA